MHVPRFEGIDFVEGYPSAYRPIGEIDVEIDGIFKSAQLRSLDDVKRLMAAEARRKGGNAIVGFEYGQRSVGFWRSLFSLDDVRWYGRGMIASV